MNTRESDFWNERSGPRIAPEHFGDIVATAADIAIVVAPSGTVVSIATNPLNSAIGSIGHWEGRNISEFLMPDSQAKVLEHLAAIEARQEGRAQAIEVNHVDGAAWDFPVRYTLHETGRDGRILLLGRDMSPVAELQQRLVRAQAALEKDYESQRTFETRYRVLMEATDDAMVLVDMSSGRIVDLNDTAAQMLNGQKQGLIGINFAQEFELDRRSHFVEDLAEIARDEGRAASSAVLRRSSTEVQLFPVLFRNAGERVMYCRIVPARGGASGAGPRSGDKLGERLRAQFVGSNDGIVFLDTQNRISHANDAFLAMVEVDSVADLRGKLLSDFLSRGLVDLKVMTEEKDLSVHLTQVVSEFGTQRPVEISTVDMNGSGVALTFREKGRVSALDQDAAGGLDGNESASSRAMSLVGSAPLRDIVASMTDVLEKQCIEAAIELTSNNRVAAADMLGLSRQSLYVKLRKYGLLNRDEN